MPQVAINKACSQSPVCMWAAEKASSAGLQPVLDLAAYHDSPREVFAR